MKAQSSWRTTLPRQSLSAGLRSWLREPGSLTRRCQARSTVFRVRLLRQQLAPLAADEALALGLPVGQQAWIREVCLEGDGQPLIFAHTALPCLPRGRLTRWFARLGERSLGSLLFRHPGFRRGPLEFKRLSAADSLQQRALAQLSTPPATPLWARRSLHQLGNQRVLVNEVFLPPLLEDRD
ncbi:MAG: hypothetical protein RIR00_1994 [Pseudomonadota bacterium]|jgi:chorismate--pyruvate lyase